MASCCLAWRMLSRAPRIGRVHGLERPPRGSRWLSGDKGMGKLQRSCRVKPPVKSHHHAAKGAQQMYSAAPVPVWESPSSDRSIAGHKHSTNTPYWQYFPGIAYQPYSFSKHRNKVEDQEPRGDRVGGGGKRHQYRILAKAVPLLLCSGPRPQQLRPRRKTIILEFGEWPKSRTHNTAAFCREKMSCASQHKFDNDRSWTANL
ncbi:hypothetical protein C2E23DRAFT_592717 [Lenzites betulinus]|nr:hypothetical protein C2E23DRAFT_592717 [Lenzites betulinus]